MLGVSIIGSGRMGYIYAQNVARCPDAELVSIINPNFASADKLSAEFGGIAMANIKEALEDPNVDAVIITTPTSSHLELIEFAARAGKAILCEKPLDLSINRVDACDAVLVETGVPFMLAFNRRFDPGVAAFRNAVKDGEVGKLQILMSTSRDPGPPPASYVKTSGGYFVDSTIHDIDLACWISQEQPVEVFAIGSCMVDPAIGAEGDVDTSMTVLKMPSGCLVHVNNSRKSVYGFDQRLEAFGSGGMVQTTNRNEDNLLRTTPDGVGLQAPLMHFFLERYAASFVNVVAEFVSALSEQRPPSVTQVDGRRALAVSLACERSRHEGRAIKPDY